METDLEARINALEQRVEAFELRVLEALNNFAAALNTERRIVANVVEIVTGKRPRRSDKAGAN